MTAFELIHFFHRPQSVQCLSTYQDQTMLRMVGVAVCMQYTAVATPPDHTPNLGVPVGEKEAKKASVIQQLTAEEIEGLKVACRVS